MIQTAFPLLDPYMGWGRTKGGAQRNDHHIVGELVANIQRDNQSGADFPVTRMPRQLHKVHLTPPGKLTHPRDAVRAERLSESTPDPPAAPVENVSGSSLRFPVR